MSDKRDKCILRITKLTTRGRGKGSLQRALKHLDKHEKSADITRPELSHLNRSATALVEKYSYKKCVALCDELRAEHNKTIDEWNATHDKPKKRHLQQDAAQCFEGLLSFSPEMEGQFDINEWVKVNKQFIKDEFSSKGCKIVRFELHRDESTCHLSFIAVAHDPHTHRSCARDILGGNKELSELQDRYADQMKQFGLSRGVSRYKEYDSVRKKAVAAGYGADLKSVEQYALDNNIELPKRRKHQSIGQYKAELQKQVLELENTVKILKADRDLIIKYFENHPDVDEFRDRVLYLMDLQDVASRYCPDPIDNATYLDVLHDLINMEHDQNRQQPTRDDDLEL